MYKTSTKRRLQSDFDIYGDLAKIKDALADVTQDVKGRAGEMLNKSFDDVMQKSAFAQEKVGQFAADKPFKTIGISLLAGALVGYLIRK